MVDITTVICAFITALVGGSMTLFGAMLQSSKNQAVTDQKIENLTHQVEKHNSLVERTYKLEAEVETLKERVSHVE